MDLGTTPADLNAHGRGTLAERMGILFTEVSVDHLVATMPVEGNTQPYGLLHGGASVVLAETLGSVGSALHAASMGMIAVGIDINATHHRSATSGIVTGVARPLALGRSLASYQVEISDGAGERICTARITCMLRPMPSS
jgi:uncharacterized protein (TIGR00369 family)